MARAARAGRAACAAEAVARIIYSPNALANLERAFSSFDERSPNARIAAVEAIRTAIEMLAHHPLIGRIVRGIDESS